MSNSTETLPNSTCLLIKHSISDSLDFVKRNILSLYEENLAKYDTENRKYQLKCENRFIIYTKDLKYQDGIMYIPIYMTMLL